MSTTMSLLRILLSNCPAQQYMTRNATFGKDPETPDLAILTETRSTSFTFPTIPNYTNIINNPRKVDGQYVATGGTGYCSKISTKLTNCGHKYTNPNFEFDNESLLLKLELTNGDKILVIIFYYSNTYSERSLTNMKNIFDNIDEITLACECDHTLMCGDWNAHNTLLNSNSPENTPGKKIKEFVLDGGLMVGLVLVWIMDLVLALNN